MTYQASRRRSDGARPSRDPLVVLGRAEPLGVEAEQDQEQQESEGGEGPEGEDEVVHEARRQPAASARRDVAHPSSIRSIARNASWGISTEPTPLHPLLAFLLLLEQLASCG